LNKIGDNAPRQTYRSILTPAEKPVCVQEVLLQLFDTQAIDEIGMCDYSRAHHPVRCEPMFPGLRQIARNFRAFPRVRMRDVRSLSPPEVAIASILAAGLWALQTRSWRRPEY